MRILILGKDGQIGWELQRWLGPLGEIIALGRAEANLEDAASLRAAVEAASPDIIVNAAAYTAVDRAESESERAERINHHAVGELGDLAAKRGAWMIHYSTDYVFDGTKTSPYLETDPTNPLNVYGRSKRDGETALAQSGASHLIFRTSWVHSGNRPNFIRAILSRAIKGEPLRVVVDQIGAPTSAALIADVTAHAVVGIQLGDDLDAGLYHLTSEGHTSWHGLAQAALSEALKLGAPIRTTPDMVTAIASADYPVPAIRPLYSVMSTEQLRTAFGIEMPSWRLAVSRSVADILPTLRSHHL